MANFKDGVIRDGSAVGAGRALGNLKGGVIRSGPSPGSGMALGNVKDGVIRNGPSAGSGRGAGMIVGKVSDFTIRGIERERDDEIVAVYHFLIKRFL